MSTDDPLTIDPATLPDDAALLKRLLVERDTFIRRIRADAATQLEAQRQEITARLEAELAAELVAKLAAQQERLEAEKKAAIAAILRRFYRPRTEHFDPRQLLLFGLAIEQAPLDEAAIAAESGEELATRRIKNRHQHGRNPLPDHLPRVEIEHDLTEAEKKCPCCGEPRCRIGQQVSEQLEYLPASFKVLRHIRYKYACGRCEHEGYNPNIATAKKPPQPIEKGLPGPGLLAFVIASKLGDHLPLYRLENIFARQQVTIARSTMCAWLAAAGDLVRPLVELMARRVRLSRAIHTDDTTVPVQAEGKCRQARIWTYLGDRANPYIVYNFTPNRTRAGPANWLREYRGYLQADAYGGYDGIYSGGHVIEVACWAHARRKFFDAQETDGLRAAYMLSLVRELYAIENEAKPLDDDERRALRQERSAPLLARIKAWLDGAAGDPTLLPRSMMGQAITYALNQWAALCAYTTEGYLNIDNNAAERALKRVAIGRKNWLFAGTDAAGQTAALLYSLIASAERHALDPQQYLTSILAQLPTTPAAELGELLPDVWKRQCATEPVSN